MSKQLGNSPDAIKLMETYGADGVRVGLLLSAAAGNDLVRSILISLLPDADSLHVRFADEACVDTNQRDF